MSGICHPIVGAKVKGGQSEEAPGDDRLNYSWAS